MAGTIFAACVPTQYEADDGGADDSAPPSLNASAFSGRRLEAATRGRDLASASPEKKKAFAMLDRIYGVMIPGYREAYDVGERRKLWAIEDAGIWWW